ncbi:hypothetical protein [Cupriavidus metallidurans]
MSRGWNASSVPAPLTYSQFITEIRQSCEKKGLTWEIPLDTGGHALKGMDWDLRLLNGSHQKIRPGTGGFAVDAGIQSLARAAGWPPSRLPAAGALASHAQDFIKAIIASRCLAGNSADNAQIIGRACRMVLSTTPRPPWELRAEDFVAFLELRPWSTKARRDIGQVGAWIDENLLSLHCPVKPTTSETVPVRLLEGLGERTAEDKLPDRTALFELARIVFQETAQTHNDAIYFLLIRLLILTGLRVAEVQMLPLDCLSWHEHLDVVTGQSADTIGGVGRSVRLRYFAEKHAEGAPDVLVEAYQWVPEKFVSEVVRAVEDARRATAPARAILAQQRRSPGAHPNSDLRSFRLLGGAQLDTSDLLLLTVREVQPHPLGTSLPSDLPINTPAGSRLYTALGRTKGSGSISFFRKYGKAPGAHRMSVQPHSLRHLLNTELFRLDVPDTVITHQFGRKTVAQSHEYDHRSLAERLRFVTLPARTEPLLPRGSSQELVARMVVSGAASASHLGQTFLQIQAERGDDAAFQYLAANADGFHVTPYGYCVNSFSISPCTRHLKCFDDCRHFLASGRVEHRVALEELQAKLIIMRDAAAAKPANTIGRKNQISHAEKLVDGVRRALDAQPGVPIFPDGEDRSVVNEDLFQ